MLRETIRDAKRYPAFWLIMMTFLSSPLAPPARGNDIETATKLMADGKFYEAAEVAAAMGDSQGLTLAARALAIYGYEIAAVSEKQELFLRAIVHAEKAVELDPDSSEASLELSHTLGRYAQTVGVAEALTGGFAEKTRAAMDRAVQLDPKNFRAHLSIGSWNAEIVAAAGFMAKILYGATEEGSLLSYQKALDLSPQSGVVHFEYAMGLMRLGDENIDLATKHLEKALALPPRDAYGKIVRDKAKQALAEIQEE